MVREPRRLDEMLSLEEMPAVDVLIPTYSGERGHSSSSSVHSRVVFFWQLNILKQCYVAVLTEGVRAAVSCVV